MRCRLARGDFAQALTDLPSPMDDPRVLDRGAKQGSHGQEANEHLNLVRHERMVQRLGDPPQSPIGPIRAAAGVGCTGRRSGGMADAAGLNPAARKAWGFESLLRHQLQRRLKMRRRCAFDATAGCSMPMTTWATFRMARVAGDCGRPTTIGTPSLTDRIMSTSV